MPSADGRCPLLTSRCIEFHNHAPIHSFIHSGYFYSASSNQLRLLFRGAPDYSTATVSEQTRRRATGKVPTWRLELDSNLRPSGRYAPNLPLSHHAKKFNHLYQFYHGDRKQRNTCLHCNSEFMFRKRTFWQNIFEKIGFTISTGYKFFHQKLPTSGIDVIGRKLFRFSSNGVYFGHYPFSSCYYLVQLMMMVSSLPKGRSIAP